MENNKVLITGAGGFIGHHLVSFLKDKGYWVRGVDIKTPEYEVSKADEYKLLDMRNWEQALEATKGIDEVYGLAADMGGMGYISCHHALILHDNALINLNTFEAARLNGIKRYFYSSSACIYPEYKQEDAHVTPLKEEDAYPAQPQDAYGWEKLFTEKLAEYYYQSYGMETRIARFHNIFGPLGSWDGGREKAPAAVCRKVAIAKLTDNPIVEIWGDGEQTRSFCYIDDCLKGIDMVMHSEFREPLNIGQDRMVTINELVEIVSKIAGSKVQISHIEGPQGVRGRNSDNSKLKQVLKWSPEISLEEGLARTYFWIEEQVKEKLKISMKESASIKTSGLVI